MPRVSLDHLKTLCAVSDCSGLVEAASRLGITQSALTHRIREAERRLGVRLFAKTGRTLRPTAAAKILTDTGEQVLDRIRAAERAAIASSVGTRHVVRLTVCDYNAYHWLSGFLSWFAGAHPEIEVEINPSSTTEALTRLAEGRLDIAILPDASMSPHAQSTFLFEDELVAVVWPGHRFVDFPFVCAKDFDSENYLTYSLATRPGFESERLWASENTMPLRKRSLGSVDAVCELIKAKAGVSVLSRWGVQREISNGTVAAVRVSQEGLYVVWRALVLGTLSKNAPAHLIVDGLATWFRDDGPQCCTTTDLS